MAHVEVIHGFTDAFLEERLALGRVLQSRLFRRAQNLSRVLEYICEQYFEGRRLSKLTILDKLYIFL